jgi:hypothetical protein
MLANAMQLLEQVHAQVGWAGGQAPLLSGGRPGAGWSWCEWKGAGGPRRLRNKGPLRPRPAQTLPRPCPAQVFERLQARAPPDAWDVRAVIDARRRRVLAGAVLAFSRVGPLRGPDGRPNPLWRLAERLGAACAEVVGDDTTHVVALQGGTEKARAPGAGVGPGSAGGRLGQAACLARPLHPHPTHSDRPSPLCHPQVLWALDHGRFVVTPAWCGPLPARAAV